MRAVRKLDGLRGEVRVRRLELPAGASLRLEYVRKGLTTVQYLTVRGDRLYALVYVTLPRSSGGARRSLPSLRARSRSTTDALLPQC